MKPFQFFYRFTSGQRRGIIALFIAILALQAGWFVFSAAPFNGATAKGITAEEKEWLAHQGELDALIAKNGEKKTVIYPFNPNFITDYKGYTLGMTLKEIDRLHAYRKQDKWINSVADFKKVTGVSDSLLNAISPYFKFPDWVIKKQAELAAKGTSPQYSPGRETAKKEFAPKKEAKIIQLDINNALEEDLVKVYGIGPAFAKKILQRRAVFGAFVSMDQMADFKDFSPEAIAGLKKYFKVEDTSGITTINVNSASLQQLSRFPYFNRDVARGILTQRSMHGNIKEINELSKINGFPVDNIKIIALYLEF